MDVPEKDRVCINCRFWLDHGEDESTCGGRKCCNWSAEYTENFFEPDEDYIRSDLAACCNCKYQEQYSVCCDCSRLDREDLWEEQT